MKSVVNTTNGITELLTISVEGMKSFARNTALQNETAEKSISRKMPVTYAIIFRYRIIQTPSQHSLITQGTFAL